jgi:hypothetical protein
MSDLIAFDEKRINAIKSQLGAGLHAYRTLDYATNVAMQTLTTNQKPFLLDPKNFSIDSIAGYNSNPILFSGIDSALIRDSRDYATGNQSISGNYLNPETRKYDVSVYFNQG